RQIARRPHGGLADVAGEYGVIGGRLVDDLGEILRVDRLAPGLADRELVECPAGIAIMRLSLSEEGSVLRLGELRQQRRQRRAEGAEPARLEPRAAPALLAAQVGQRGPGTSPN